MATTVCDQIESQILNFQIRCCTMRRWESRGALQTQRLCATRYVYACKSFLIGSLCAAGPSGNTLVKLVTTIATCPDNESCCPCIPHKQNQTRHTSPRPARLTIACTARQHLCSTKCPVELPHLTTSAANEMECRNVRLSIHQSNGRASLGLFIQE